MTPEETPVVEEVTTETPAEEVTEETPVVETPTEEVVEETPVVEAPVEEVVEAPVQPNAAVDLAPRVITQSRGPARPVQEIARQEMPVDDRFATDETRKMSAGGLPIAE